MKLVVIIVFCLHTFLVTAQTNQTVRARLKLGAWKDRPTRRLDDLRDFKSTEKIQLDRFGGWVGEKSNATGFFYAKKIGDRWWLIDPEGNRYFNIAVNSITPGKPLKGDEGSPKFRFSDSARVSFEKHFGDLDGWRDKTLAMIREAGFNSTGSWSADVLLRTANRPVAYTPNLGWMSKYGSKRGGTFATPGHTGYPNDCIFTFDPEFAAFCDEQAKSLAKNKDDPYLLGYFSDNEMPMPKTSLDKFLSLPAGDAGRTAVEGWMKDRKIDRTKIIDADRDEWLGHVADTYYGTVNRAMKKYDPDHLYLGSRFYSSEKRCEPFVRAAGKHLDLISVNLYGVWTPGDEVKNLTKWSGKPVLVTEWYAKGDDSGLPNTEGAGFTVPTQRDRGAFYQNFTLALLETKVCVGWHWFKYIDNDPSDKGAGLSNQDANKGIVSADFEPYIEILAAMKQLNAVVYPLTIYFDRK